MNVKEYKADLLAREEIDDIVKIEAVDLQKVNGRVEQVEHQLETGRTMRMYDVHVIGMQGNQKNRFTIPVAVYDQGTATETVEELRKPVEREVTESQIETYIYSLPFVGIRNLDVDKEKLEARFEAIELTGPNSGREVKVFAYKPQEKAPTYVILE